MDRIKTLIVDDEALARKGIEASLRNDPGIELVGSCANGPDALKAIRKHTPALMFLDVQMPGMDGFQLLSQVSRSRMPVVIFVTAYDEYALQAFEVHALDYLLKSYSDDRFDDALARAKQHIREKETWKITDRLATMLESHELEKQQPPAAPDSTPTRAADYLTRLVIKEGGRIFFIKTDEIDWIESADYYVCLHLGRKSHLLRETMAGIEKKLDPNRFQRTHRSSIVNLDCIKELLPHQFGDYIVVLHDGTKLKLSRTYRPKLAAALRMAL